jgi:hypothetical protein
MMSSSNFPCLLDARNSRWMRVAEKCHVSLSLILLRVPPAEEDRGRDAADRGIEQFDHMEGGHSLQAATAKAAHELEEAPGVGGDDCLRLGGEEPLHFAVAKLAGRFGMEKIVDAGRAAAEAGLVDFVNFEAWDGGEETARLLIDALSMTEMAGVMVGDAHGQRVTRRLGRELAEDL